MPSSQPYPRSARVGPVGEVDRAARAGPTTMT